MRESQIELPVVARAERAGFYVRKVQWPGRRSAPDRIFAHPARGTVWIEFKAPGKVETLSQREEHRKMRAAGMEVYVCDSVEQAIKVLWLETGSVVDPEARRLV